MTSDFNRSTVVPATIAVVLSCLTGCGRQARPIENTWMAMGTYASVALPAADSRLLRPCTDTAREAIAALEAELSLFRPASEISRINQSAGRGPVPVSGETRDVLQLALFYAEVSGGRFDVTIGPLVRFWGFNGGTVPRELPDKKQILRVREQTGYRRLSVRERTAYLAATNMMVDLGGIAKGYAVDVCFHKITTSGVSNVMVNLGGNLRCAGFARGTTPWRVGVRNPFDTDTVIGSLNLTAGRAVATSGNYERFVTIDGKRYAHVIDPLTGYPVQGMAGVTVIAASAVEADAMSTALFVAGIDNAPELLARFRDCDVIMIPDRRPLTIYVSTGAKAYFTPAPDFAASVQQLRPVRETPPRSPAGDG